VLVLVSATERKFLWCERGRGEIQMFKDVKIKN
jgi:hypothetical protein